MQNRTEWKVAMGWILLEGVLFGGCASMSQDPDVVLVREPGNRTYNSPVPVMEMAKSQWEYAVLSENVYFAPLKGRVADTGEPTTEVRKYQTAAPEEYARSCTPDSVDPLPLPGWTRWSGFPSRELWQEAREVGLFVEVWEKASSPPVVAVVFRGTEFTSIEDWISNLRWFLRFVPFYPDQYTVVAQRVGKEVIHRLAQRADRQELRLVTTGHSLGGGLAQHLAYSLPIGGPRVSHVYAFDPSPVTGWSAVGHELRRANAEGLEIDRVFEHGEILAYVRLLLSYVNPPSAADPAIREIRYNFIESVNPLKRHSIRFLACALIKASGQVPLPDLRERFRGRE